MAVYYTKEKSKYGGLAGMIIPFMIQLSDINNPPDFKELLPAGYLRCDGSILPVSQYPTLAAICGVGSNCKFAKDPDSLSILQFQLPDLGSKYVRCANSSGQILNAVLDQDENVSRVGTETTVTSLVGDQITIRYSGSFEVIGQTIPFGGNPLYTTSEPETLDSQLTEENFQAHGHNADVGVITYTGAFESSGYASKSFGAQGGGNDAQTQGQNQLVLVDPPEDSSFVVSHNHRINLPTSGQLKDSSTLSYVFDNTDITANGLETEVFITTKNVKKLDTAISPYILVEFIIKI